MLGLTGSASFAAEAISAGTIIGSISSAGSKNALQGATVTIPALNRTEFTDNAGAYSFQSVPAGTQEIVINYTGVTEMRERVVVSAGQTARLDAGLKSSEVLAMAPFTVESVSEGQALALTQQRNAANIKNVTAFDEWGVLPTQNVAELLTRLPGISVAHLVIVTQLNSNLSKFKLKALLKKPFRCSRE